MSDVDPAVLTISSALTSLRAGDISPADLTEACYHRIKLLDPKLNAFIHVASAELLENGSKGFLQHIPIAIKDLFDVAGMPTTGGSPGFFGQEKAEKDACIVEKLKTAGAIIIGKTNMHEIALGVTGVNPHYGPSRNPWDQARISGGSSSGSAVALAAGMCLGALGTDTGGSIRIPSSLCGVIGLKPTYGRVSLRGVIPLSWNLDHVGPMARSVRDVALLLHVIAGYDPLDPVCANVHVDDYLGHLDDGVMGWKIAVAVGDYFNDVDTEVGEAVQVAAKIFESLGAHVEEVELSWVRELAIANGVVVQADAAAFHRERLSSHPDWFGADVRQRLQTGADCTSTDYVLMRRIQSEMSRQFVNLFKDHDVLLTPTTPIPAPLIEGTDAIEQARRLTRFTAPFNLSGLPALTIPCGCDDFGLPIGLQVISGSWRETKVLQAGNAYESATEWHLRHPNL